MMSQEQQPVSASTRYRYEASGRIHELPAFLDFKKEFQHHLDISQIAQLKRVYKHAVLGRNERMQTVVLDRVGQIKIAELTKVIDDEMLFGYICQRVLSLSEATLKEKEQVVWIIDLQGKIMQLASKRVYALLHELIPVLQRFFPNLIAKLIFVNTPMLFDTIWPKLAEKLHPETLSKVVFYADDLEELSVYADPTLLPVCLGGDRADESVFSAECEEPQPEKEEDEQEIDLSSLKEALSGLKLGGANHPSVANTPLNTEADEYKKQ